MLEEQKSKLIELFTAGQFHEAKNKVEDLPEDDQNSAFVQNFLGVISLAEEAIAEALQFFEQACCLDPNYSASFKNLAIGYLRLNEFSKALTNVEKVLEKEPTDPDALHIRGCIRLQSGSPQLALVDFKQSVSLVPANPKFQNSIGLAYLEFDELLKLEGILGRRYKFSQSFWKRYLILRSVNGNLAIMLRRTICIPLFWKWNLKMKRLF